MHRGKLFFCLPLVLVGCSGRYILTAGDHVVTVGGEAPVVIRLQRSEVYKVAMSVKDAPVQFRIGDGPERWAFTDGLGYAGTPVPVPAKTGKYRVDITYQDREGDVLNGEAAVYAWHVGRPAVAVDLDCLPPAGGNDAEAAASALTTVGRRANILYLTRRPVAEHQRVHADLEAAGYPDGPVLLWQREYWHVRPVGKYAVLMIAVESRLISQLAQVRKAFPRLDVGICASDLAARAFTEAGLRCLIVGQAEVGVGNAMHRKSWEELAAAGI